MNNVVIITLSPNTSRTTRISLKLPRQRHVRHDPTVFITYFKAISYFYNWFTRRPRITIVIIDVSTKLLRSHFYYEAVIKLSSHNNLSANKLFALMVTTYFRLSLFNKVHELLFNDMPNGYRSVRDEMYTPCIDNVIININIYICIYI